MRRRHNGKPQAENDRQISIREKTLNLQHKADSHHSFCMVATRFQRAFPKRCFAADGIVPGGFAVKPGYEAFTKEPASLVMRVSRLFLLIQRFFESDFFFCTPLSKHNEGVSSQQGVPLRCSLKSGSSRLSVCFWSVCALKENADCRIMSKTETDGKKEANHGR